MSLKRLFGDRVSKDVKKDIVSLANFTQYLDDVESIGYVEAYIKDKNSFKAHTDYTTGSNFAVFGSLAEYYEAGARRIQEEYPYDGSLREKQEYFNNSSGFDLHLFEKEYPRTTGFITISANRAGGNGWGSGTTSGSYGNPGTKEYIYIKGGPNIGNFYNTASYRSSNLEINGDRGNTVEFWLKKTEYVTAKTQREVIFDAHTINTGESKSGHGRMTIELDSSNGSKSPFYLTYQSGTTGFKNLNVGDSTLFNSVKDGGWHHYAFTFKNLSGSVLIRGYIDGTPKFSTLTGSAVGELNTPIVGTIGALATGKNTLSTINRDFHQSTAGLGYGKLSGSLDEFRFWKKERSSKEVGRFFNTQVGAGSNEDIANTPLGVYYKFNEGTTGVTEIDNVILDYSGRVTNGQWVGYAGVGRNNGSAITESSSSFREFKDPIIYKQHPKVLAFTDEKKELGYAYDLDNNSSLYYTMPAWIVDEDGDNGNQLRKVTQIVASYFDSLYQQIKDFRSITERKYHSLDNKPHPFNDVKLESLGLVTPELFLDTETINLFLNRNEDDEFKQKLSDVKNFIYNNIYNNLEAIYKSKGTEKSFRNLFRCFGIDNELIKINLYSTDSEYPIENGYSPVSVKTKYVNFSTEAHTDSSIIQTIDGLTGDYRLADARGYVTGTLVSEAHNFSDFGSTTQVQVFFPPRYPIGHPFYFSTPVSSSIMGCHTVRKKTGTPGQTDSKTGEKYLADGSLLAWTSESDDVANFQLYVAKDTNDSRTAKFVLKCRNNLFSTIETPYIVDLYDSNRWNVAVRVGSDIPFSSNVSGSAVVNKIELIACESIGDAIKREYHIQGDFNTAGTAASAFIQYNSSGGQLPADGNFINLISAQGTSKRYEFDSNGSVTGGSISVTIDAGSVTNTYTNLMNAVNAASGHDGEIVATFDAGNRKITFTQSIVGDIGETEAADSIANATVQCHFQGGVNSTTQDFGIASKRFYLGAHRKDFDDQLQDETDVKVANFRHWLTSLEKEEIRRHAIDPSSYGLLSPSQMSFPLSNIGNVQIPQIDLLAINWDFSNLTGSNKTGQMWINDVSSGSLDDVHRLGSGKVGAITKVLHPAKGINFAVSTTSSVDLEIDSAAKLQTFENIRSSDMVKINLNDDQTFTRETKPIDYYYSFEKSMYSAISDEMMNFFAGVNDFSNLIGAPVEKYRQDYKAMSKLRQVFFDRIQNEPDIERYMEYYKWLDSSLSIMIDQLIPASVESSNDIQNVIESHILERNKYRSKYQGINLKEPTIIGNVRGINELLYDWQHGHAPFDADRIITEAGTGYTGNTTITIPDGTVDGSSLGFTCSGRVGCNSTITLNDGSSTRIIYVTMNIGDGNDDIVSASGGPGDGTMATRLAAAINGSSSGAVAITAAVTTDGGSSGNGTASVVTLTHDSGGTFTITYGSNSNMNATFVKPAIPDVVTVVKAKSGDNCLWKKERAQRVTDTSSGNVVVDRDREIIRRIANTNVSGSTYVTRRLTRPYKFTVENQREVKGGSSFFGNSKRRFYAGVTKPSHKTYIAITGSEIQRVDCTDVQIPNEKKKWAAPADISHTSKDHDSDLVSPFSLYSSSLDDPKDYHAEIFSKVKKGVEISNLHTDAYGDDKEVTLQSPFTEKFVGGSAFRHVGLNKGQDSETTRFEGFRLLAQGQKLYVLPPNASGLTTGKVPIINESYATSRFLREPLAKSPVNIKNIKVNSLGNYNHVSDIVQFTSPRQSGRFVVDNLEQLTSSTPQSAGNSSPLFGAKEFGKLPRTTRKNTITSRFSAPGGTEVAGDSRGGQSLDRETNQFSVYNSMNYRNLSVRGPRNYLDHLSYSSSVGSTNLETDHKININTRPRRVAYFDGSHGSSNSTVTIKKVKDNKFVTHPIPQNDHQYSWISASLRDGLVRNQIPGHLHSFTQASLGTATGSMRYERTYEFLTGSAIKEKRGSNIRKYVLDFAGLNTHVVDNINTDTNTVSSINSQFLTGTILHRQGPYGWPSWKQIRGGESQLGRLLRKRNIYAPVLVGAITPDENGLFEFNDESFLNENNAGRGVNAFNASYFSQGNYSWPKNIDHKRAQHGRRVPSSDQVGKTQYRDSFSSETADTVPEGWATHLASTAAVTTGPRIKANANDSSQKILALIGTADTAFASYTALNETFNLGFGFTGTPDSNLKRLRSVEYSAPLTAPLVIKYEFIVGSDSSGLSQDFGLTNAPEAQEDLFLQYKIGESGKYKTLHHIKGSELAKNFFHERFAVIDEPANKVFFRWVSIKINTTDHDHYGIRGVRINKLGTDYRFNEPPVTINKYPIRTLSKPTTGRARPVLASYTFSNNITNFANEELAIVTDTKLTKEQKKNTLKRIDQFSLFPLNNEAYEPALYYREGIFPKEKNAFLKSSRGRPNFKLKFWRKDHKSRIQRDALNSQGEKISRLSIWPLDAQQNFKTVALRKTTDRLLGTDSTGAEKGAGSGELFAEYSIFHNNHMIPSASALFARPFPMQSTSSLPARNKYKILKLSGSYSNNMQPRGPYTFKSKTVNIPGTKKAFAVLRLESQPTAGKTLILTSTAGIVYKFTAHASVTAPGDGSNGSAPQSSVSRLSNRRYRIGADVSATVDNFISMVNLSGDTDGLDPIGNELVATREERPTGIGAATQTYVVITQARPGAAGNTVITGTSIDGSDSGTWYIASKNSAGSVSNTFINGSNSVEPYASNVDTIPTFYPKNSSVFSYGLDIGFPPIGWACGGGGTAVINLDGSGNNTGDSSGTNTTCTIENFTLGQPHHGGSSSGSLGAFRVSKATRDGNGTLGYFHLKQEDGTDVYQDGQDSSLTTYQGLDHGNFRQRVQLTEPLVLRLKAGDDRGMRRDHLLSQPLASLSRQTTVSTVAAKGFPKINGGGTNRYAWARTTSSYQFPGVIRYHANGSDGNMGLNPNENPLYVQVGSNKDGVWHTVGVLTGSALTSSYDPAFRPVITSGDKISSDNNVKYHPFEHVVTASIKGNIRFVTHIQKPNYNSSGFRHGNFERSSIFSQWLIAFVNVYEMKEVERQIFFDRENFSSRVGVGITEMHNTASLDGNHNAGGNTTSGDTIRLPRKNNLFRPDSAAGVQSAGTVREYYSPNVSSFGESYQIPTAIDFKNINNYADIRYTNIKTPGLMQGFVDASGSYDFEIRVTSSKAPHMIYAKNDKLDNCLWGSQFYKVPEDEARNPFNFDSYEDFSYQSKLLAKGYSVLPEFRISEHMHHYINDIGGEDPFFSCRDTFLTLTGALGDSNSSSTGSGDFYKTYSHTDFMKQFNVVQESIDETYPGTSDGAVSPTRLTLTCKAFKKFLPYKGFYPADRMTQMASYFSSSYNQYVSGGHWRNVLAPYYAPGIGFNTVKSGLAVDYPVFEPHEDRLYNQYGVIFQSASLLADFKGSYFGIGEESFSSKNANGETQFDFTGPGDSVIVNSNTTFAEVKNGVAHIYAGAALGDNDTFVITSLDGTVKTYTAKTSPSDVESNLQFAKSANIEDESPENNTGRFWADGLISLIESASGHNGKIACLTAERPKRNYGTTSVTYNLYSDAYVPKSLIILTGVKTIVYSGTPSKHESENAGSSNMTSVVARQFDAGFLSKNRIEIGDASHWGQALTGSDFENDGKFGISFWMYLPSTNEIDPNVSSNNKVFKGGSRSGENRLLGQRGVVCSLGSGNDMTMNSWRTGLHLTYQVSPFMDNVSETENILGGTTSSDLVGSDGSTPDAAAVDNVTTRGGDHPQAADFKYSPGDKSHAQIYFQLFGGDGRNHFCWQSGPGMNSTGSMPGNPLVEADWAHPGWNHFYIEADLKSRELQHFKVFRNGHQYTTSRGAAQAGELNTSLDHNNAPFGNLGRTHVQYFHSDYDHTNSTSTRTTWTDAASHGGTNGTAGAPILLDGARNCFIGNHLGNVNRINNNMVSGTYSQAVAVVEVTNATNFNALSNATTIFSFNTTDGETVTFKAASSQTVRGDFDPTAMNVEKSSTARTVAKNIWKAVNAHPKLYAHVFPSNLSPLCEKVYIYQLFPGSAGNVTITNNQIGSLRFLNDNKFVGGEGGLGAYHYSEQKRAVALQGLTNQVDRSNAVAGELNARGGLFAPRTKDFLLDFLKPSELMMSEIVVVNKSLSNDEIKGLSGAVKNPQFNNNFTSSFGVPNAAPPRVNSSGKFIGPTNPYTIIDTSKHDNIIAWYRPGNDTGYNKKTTNEAQNAAGGRHATTNRLPVFNHAQPLHSGKVITAQTGSVNAYGLREDFPFTKNFLSGTFYGFTDWSGSIVNDIPAMKKQRQRWNGIVDVSNPYQYTYIYHSTENPGLATLAGAASFGAARSAAFRYKTWRFPFKSQSRGNASGDYWTEFDFGQEKNVIAFEKTFKDFALQITGAVRLPSYIQGSKHNFTDDASIPRIGSASYGTSHFTGSGDDSSVFSHGWRSLHGNTGVRKVTRIPFEAIIEPEIFTPPMEEDGEINTALFYDMEPHPSASLNATFLRDRRFVGTYGSNKDKFVFKSDFNPLKADGVTSEYSSNDRFVMGLPKHSASNLATFDMDLAKSKTSLYAAAAHNFYAESLNFFIENKKGVTIRSSDELKEAVVYEPHPVLDGAIPYKMQISLVRGDSDGNRQISGDNPMYNNPAAFGPPVDAGSSRDPVFADVLPRSLTQVGYGFSPYTPPHYDRVAYVDYTFTPQEDVVYDSVESVLRDTEVVYSRMVRATGSIGHRATGRTNNTRTTPSYNKTYAMQLSESFYGLSADNETAFVQSYNVNGEPISGKRSLVLQTKFECPTFDFTKVTANQPRTNKTVQHLPQIRGVWHQSGDFGENSLRPRVNVIGNQKPSKYKRDLKSLLGVQLEGDGIIGKMPEQRVISEAVVAIPFVTSQNTKQFFKLPEEEVYQAVRDQGFPNYKQLTEQDIADQRTNASILDNILFSDRDDPRRTLNDGVTKVPVRNSVAEMVKNMLRYNIPPQLNFLKYNDKNGKYIEPFAMYIFPFDVTLSKQDIARIWQNTTPNIGLDFAFGQARRNGGEQTIQEVTVSHELFSAEDLLNPNASLTEVPRTGWRVEGWSGGISQNLQWMVFKVKQKAETNFFRKKQLDRLPDGHPEKVLSIEKDKFNYGFNWPYDYFSLVELINLDAEVEFKFKRSLIVPDASGLVQLKHLLGRAPR